MKLESIDTVRESYTLSNQSVALLNIFAQVIKKISKKVTVPFIFVR